MLSRDAWGNAFPQGIHGEMLEKTENPPYLCYGNRGEDPCDDKMSVVGFGTVILFEP